MQRTAQNAYVVRYSLSLPDRAPFSLTFIVAGEEANLILLQRDERSGPRDIGANPGPFDQRVYGLEKINEIKAAVVEKIFAHLGAGVTQH